MRIAFPYYTYWPYARRGVERCIHDLAGFLARKGHDVHVITSTPGRGRTTKEDGVRITYLPQLAHPLLWHYTPLLSMHVFGLQAAKLLQAERPDVMHTFHCAYLLAAPLLRTMTGTPYLLHFVLNADWTDHKALKRQARSAAVLAGVSRAIVDSVETQFARPSAFLPPPVDMNFFRPNRGKKRSDPIVFFPGDLADARKGGGLLLRAWNRVHRECPRAVLVLGGPIGPVGWLPFEFGYESVVNLDLVEDAGARAAIELRGPGDLDDLPAWYSEAAVTVLPSLDEAFGMVLTESLACGTPVIAGASGGPSEIVTHPDVGATIPIMHSSDLESPAMADRLAEAILNAIDLSSRTQTSQRCREWASQWSLERVGMEEERLLEAASSGSVSRAQVAEQDPAFERSR